MLYYDSAICYKCDFEAEDIAKLFTLCNDGDSAEINSYVVSLVKNCAIDSAPVKDVVV